MVFRQWRGPWVSRKLLGYPSTATTNGRALPIAPTTLARSSQRRSRGNLWLPMQLLVIVLLFGTFAGASLAWVQNLGLGLTIPWLTSASPQAVAAQQDDVAGLGVLSENTFAAHLLVDNSRPFALHPWAKHSFVPAIMYHDVVAGEKQVWFDSTVEELRADLEAIRQAGATPIGIDQLYRHLRLGEELPPKPILLTFDDAYLGQYENAYPLLQEYGYPAAYFVQTGYVGVPTSKEHFTWEQLGKMDAEGLVTIAAHTVNHPEDLRLLNDERLHREIVDSKRILEEKLGHPVDYFAYPAGNQDGRVQRVTAEAGFKLSFTMEPGFTGESENLLEVRRFIETRIPEALVGANFSPESELASYPLNVATPVKVQTEEVEGVKLTTLRGGRFATVHADQRYDVGTLLDRYHATAGINGGFFSLPWIYAESNVMVGPVMSSNHHQFIPGRLADNLSIRGRPLVLLGKDRLSFVPFDPETMNDLESIQQLMPDVTDLFVAGVWLVKEGQPLSLPELESFHLSSAAEHRPRVFIGVDRDDRVVAGVTDTHINSLQLTEILPQLGVREAVLLDSGFSSSLVYEGKVMATGHATAEEPSRPVPHAILLYDLLKLQASSAPVEPLQQVVNGVPAGDRPLAQSDLEAVLSGKTQLRKGDRGPAMRAIQEALQRVAQEKGKPNPLPSGIDGVFGSEVSQAIARYATRTTSSTAAAVETIDGGILKKLLDDVAKLPASILVDPALPSTACPSEEECDLADASVNSSANR